MKKSFGENTKWKWSFVDVNGRYAAVAKNIFDLKRFMKMNNPGDEGYKDRNKHIKLIQKLLLDSSNWYRQKYELTTKDIEDLKKAIDYQKALLRIATMLNNDEKIQKYKKQIGVWKTLLEKDLNAKKSR